MVLSDGCQSQTKIVCTSFLNLFGGPLKPLKIHQFIRSASMLQNLVQQRKSILAKIYPNKVLFSQNIGNFLKRKINKRKNLLIYVSCFVFGHNDFICTYRIVFLDQNFFINQLLLNVITIFQPMISIFLPIGKAYC